MLEASFLPPRSKDVAQGVKLDLLANVELDQHQHRPLQRLALRDGCGMGGNRNGGFAVSIERPAGFVYGYCYRKRTGWGVGE